MGNDSNNLSPEDMLNGLEFENQELRNKNLQLNGAMAGAGFENDQNVINYQLETDKILERVEHFLKGDQVKFNKDGAYFAEPTKNVLCSVKKDPKTNFKYFFQEIKESKKGTETTKEVLVKIVNLDGGEVLLNNVDNKLISSKLKKVTMIDEGYKYAEIIDEDKKPLNEYGVAELMRIMSMYVTKETILSTYTEERINEILGDLGDALNEFLYCNYEKMGMDTKFKESKYIMICLNLLHVVESCYRRAIGGAEQEYIKTKAIITQGNNLGNGQRPIQAKQKWNPLKPNTW